MKKNTVRISVCLSVLLILCIDAGAADPVSGFISAKNVRIRKEPGVKSEIVAYAKAGYPFEIVCKTKEKDTVDGYQDFWYFNGKGWVFGKFLSFEERLNAGSYIESLPMPAVSIGDFEGSYFPAPMEINSFKETIVVDQGFDVFPNAVIKVNFGNFDIFSIKTVSVKGDSCVIKAELTACNYMLFTEEDINEIFEFVIVRKNGKYQVNGEAFQKNKLSRGKRY